MREQLINHATTTLSSSCTSSATTISVTTGSVFPATGNFRLICGSEIMLCTGRSTNTLTVVRGYESTTGASHSSGATISCVLTVGSVQTYLTDAVHNYSLPSRPSVGRLLDASGNTLTSSSFTVTNTVSATVTDQAGTIVVDYPPLSLGGFNFVTLMRSAPSTPYSVITALQTSFAGFDSCKWWTGIAVADTSGKLVTNALYFNDLGGIEIDIAKMNSGTSDDSSYATNYMMCLGLYFWLKTTDDGTNLTFYMSHDGVNWNQTFQVSRTDWLSAGPTSVGLFATVLGTAPSDGSSANGVVTFAHYSEG